LLPHQASNSPKDVAKNRFLLNVFNVGEETINKWTKSVVIGGRKDEEAASEWIEENAEQIIEWMMTMFSKQVCQP